MVKHIILWNLKDEFSSEEKEHIKKSKSFQKKKNLHAVRGFCITLSG